jgi:CopG family transcriptional regulator, nickel-responsive regulator
MDNVVRFSVSLEDDLLAKLDDMVGTQGFPNRSQAIRFLINQAEVKRKWNANETVAGAIVIVYDHHKRDLQNKSTQIQHDFEKIILAVQHVHLDHDNCLETITIKGKARELQRLADLLKGLKGVKHAELVMSKPQ